MIKKTLALLFFLASSAHASQMVPGRMLLGVKDEGTFLGRVSTMNFVGAGVIATINGGTATITIGGGGGSSGLPLPDNSTTYVQIAGTQTMSGGLTLTNPTTIQVSLMSPNLRLISMNAYPMPLLIGNNASSALTAIGFQNGSISTNAVIGYIGNTQSMFFGVKGNSAIGYDFLTYDGGASGGVSFGTKTMTNNSVVSISSGAGTTGSLLRISTGLTDLVNIAGTQITMNTVPVFLGSTTINGGVTLNGTGPSSITPLNGPLTVAGDMSFPTTWYTGISFPISVGSVGMTNSIGYSTNSLNGRAYFDGTAAGSAPANAAFYEKAIPQNYVFGSTPTLSTMVSYSTGVTTQNHAYIISFATAAQHTDYKNLVYTSTVVYTVSGNTTASGGIATTRTRVLLNGLCNLIGSGDSDLFIRVARDGDNAVSDPAQSFSALIDAKFLFRVQQ